MVSVKVMAFAGVAGLMATAANAADMPQLMPPMPMPLTTRISPAAGTCAATSA